MFGEGLPRTLSGCDLRCASAAGRQKFRHLGRSGPAFLKRSPIPPPPSPFLIDVRGGAARAPGAGVGGQRSHGRRSAADFRVSERPWRAAANVRRWGMGSPGPGAGTTSVAPRLRDGKSLVACAPRAFADPSASITRSAQADSPSVVPRLRDGAGYVTGPQRFGAHKKFADPSASVTRSMEAVIAPAIPAALSIYFASSGRILMLRNDTRSPWSCSVRCPLVALPKAGMAENLLLATRSSQSGLPFTNV